MVETLSVFSVDPKHRSHTNHSEGVSKTADLTVSEPRMACDKYITMAEIQDALIIQTAGTPAEQNDTIIRRATRAPELPRGTMMMLTMMLMTVYLGYQACTRFMVVCHMCALTPTISSHGLVFVFFGFELEGRRALSLAVNAVN